jgi:hypothetical protein
VLLNDFVNVDTEFLKRLYMLFMMEIQRRWSRVGAERVPAFRPARFSAPPSGPGVQVGPAPGSPQAYGWGFATRSAFPRSTAWESLRLGSGNVPPVSSLGGREPRPQPLTAKEGSMAMSEAGRN